MPCAQTGFQMEAELDLAWKCLLAFAFSSTVALSVVPDSQGELAL